MCSFGLFLVVYHQVLHHASAKSVDYLGMIIGHVALWNYPMESIPNQQRSLKDLLKKVHGIHA
jgi:hypothetical protein